MTGIPFSPDRFPPGTSRYTLAIAKCLSHLPPEDSPQPGRGVVQALINLVQGRMLEYMADRICREFGIEDDQAQMRMVTVLMGIFSDEFFALFRTRIDTEPALVLEIARRISRRECRPRTRPDSSPTRKPSDRLYPAIFRKFFEYRHLEVLLALIESDAEIQKIILACLLERRPADPAIHRKLLSLADADPEGLTSNLFMGYVRRDNVETLLEKFHSGAWESDLEALKTKMASLRGE